MTVGLGSAVDNATVDMSKLTAAIEAADTKIGNAVAGTDLGQYPQSAINEFNEAIATAQTVVNDKTATQTEINQAVTNLEAAEKKFDAAKVTTADAPLEPLVTDLRETETGPSWINWSWVNPAGTDFSRVMIYINDTFVTNTSDSTINSYNATGLSDGVIYTISIRTVNISGSISFTPTIDSATTIKLPNIYSLSGTNITTSSITLIWEVSDDTTLVKILRNDVVLTNTSDSAPYVDTNLSSSTTYNYTLIPYNEDGLEGKAVTVSLDTVSSHSSGGGGSSISKKSNSGGGGGVSSSEEFKNIALKDTDSQYLKADTNATYEFSRPENDIQSISFYSLKNSGEVTSTIEVLNNRSKLVNSNPGGLIYEYINIWVGKAGFATPDNIKDSRIRFKVNSSWIQKMGVAPTDVKLQRYNGTTWEMLPTTFVSDTTDYVVFESNIPGFSPFAITAEKILASTPNSEMDTKPAQEAVVTIEQTQPEKSGIWTFLKALLMIEVLAVGYEYRKRRKKE